MTNVFQKVLMIECDFIENKWHINGSNSLSPIFPRKLEIQFMDEDVWLICDYHPIIHVNRQHEIETESRLKLKVK